MAKQDEIAVATGCRHQRGDDGSGTGIINYTQPVGASRSGPAAMAAATLATLPMLVIVVFFRRYFHVALISSG